ncbi:MAG: sigma-70 family RNA polymerase sigma factor [Planctomycetes bacterium]|nr:sigma-70 family RNA polymerase sigma factor [Planctomycetota bacterium]
MESLRSSAEEWRAARGGDAEARGRLARLALDTARRELARRRVAASDLEDLAQEAVMAFLAFLDERAEAPREIGGFVKWRALGVLSDQRKRLRVRSMEHSTEAPAELASGAAGPGASARAAEVRAALEACRERLRPESRAVLALRYEGGLEAEEIALRLGVTRNAIHVRTFRALAALRACLERRGIDPEDAP